ncbi:MAG: retroviral-like aspartic protease family protein [Flavobacterium sp.]|uniref:retroviral-like aspartic protease family protein n=1 Tax=Flavobacterium sp. TaxID=239 RepID=UPI003BC25424
MKIFLYLICFFYSTLVFSQCIVGNCENGEGTYIFEDKTKIIGYWKDNKATGNCQIFYTDGSSYNGEMKENQLYGVGKLITKDNVIYEGFFINGFLNGKGKRSDPDGYTLEGNFINDTLTGVGSIKYSSGSLYKGEILNFLRNGKGIYQELNGDTFEGNFKGNKIHGEGIWKYAKGGTLKGTWFEGKFISGPKLNGKNENILNLIPTSGGVYEVNVTFNKVLKIDMILDTGASEVFLTPDIVLTLFKAKTISEEDILEGGYFMDASGNVNKSVRFNMKEIKLGNVTLENVNCGINTKIDGVNLFGLSALKKLKSIKFNFTNNTLEIE